MLNKSNAVSSTQQFYNNNQLVLHNDGSVQVIGASQRGALGLGDDISAVKHFSLIEKLADKQIVKLVSGSDFNVVIDKDGVMHSWGQNNYGQLGNTSQLTNPVPKPIKSLASKKITDVTCGDNFCLALTNEGEVYSWGCGSSGQLGQGNTMDLSQPKPVPVNFKAKSISCGEAHSA